MPIAKIWMGKSLSGMTDSGAVVSADAESDEDGSVSINVKVIRKPVEEQGE